jgi:hypothetical protein
VKHNPNMKPKILLLDIETTPANAYVWSMYGVNVGIEQLMTPSQILAVGTKWLGEKGVRYVDTWPALDKESRSAMLRPVYEQMQEADAVVTFNGDKFDLPKLRGEFMLQRWKPAAPFVSIDVRRTTSGMGFTSGRLAHVADLVECRRKRKHDGFSLWRDYMDGSDAARREMKLYCKQDVQVLEDVYLTVRPYIRTPFYFGDAVHSCPACQSTEVSDSGKRRRTRCFKIEQWQCDDCGAWFDGARRKA